MKHAPVLKRASSPSFLLALPLLAIAVALGLTSSASAQNAVGINVHFAEHGVVDLAVEAGVQWIRVDANWFQMEPSRESYNWVQDTGVSAAQAAGLNVYMTLAYTPEWVAKVPRARSDTYTGNDEPVGSAEWVSFVEAAVLHYRSLGVTHYGLWNEPNLDHFWDGNIDSYVDKIALPGAAAIRRVCADCVTLGPDLAHVGDVDEALDRVMRGASAFDIFAHHIYGGWPENGHTVFDGDSFINALEMRRFAFTRESLRAILNRHGWTGEVWITETGYRASPIGSAGEETKQATYVRRVLEEQLVRDWWTNSFFYEVADCGIDLPDCDIDGFGLTRPTRAAPRSVGDYTRKPAFETLRSFISTHPEFGGEAPVMDAGVIDGGSDDAGPGPTDGGSIDGGSVDADAPDGSTLADAGSTSDAGDAGALDAGVPGADSGFTPGPERSSGGCNAAGTSASWWAFPLLIALRRRRAQAAPRNRA